MLDLPFRTLRRTSILVGLFIGLASTAVIGEEKICAPGPCVNRESPIEFSKKNSVAAFVGTFKFEADDPKRNRNLSHIVFEARGDVSAGQSTRPLPTLSIPATRILRAPKQATGQRIDGGAAWNAWDAYLRGGKQTHEGLAAAEQQFVASLDGLQGVPRSVAVVSVRPGGIDEKVRIAEVPIVEGRQYVVFVFRDIAGSNADIFPWDIDIYPVEFFERGR